MNQQTVTISKTQLATDFRKSMEGKVSEELIKATENGLDNTTAYAANGSIASAVIYQWCNCAVSNGKTFSGKSWGISFPGGGALFGTVYTSNINNLYSQTTSFAFTGTAVYTAFYFYDDNHNLLGTFQAGSVSTVSGTGGGSGSWS
jgi:Rhodococcus equi virulence-associated protein